MVTEATQAFQLFYPTEKVFRVVSSGALKRAGYKVISSCDKSRQIRLRRNLFPFRHRDVIVHLRKDGDNLTRIEIRRDCERKCVKDLCHEVAEAFFRIF